MLEIYWSKPVEFEGKNRMRHSVLGPAEALEFLRSAWPTKTGRHYQNAETTCMKALHRQCSSEEAREVFISALLEANLPPVATRIRARPLPISRPFSHLGN